MKLSAKQYLPLIATLAMLAYLAFFAKLEIATAGVPEYMARSKAAIEALPLHVGPFEAVKQPLDVQAQDLLKPNAENCLYYTGILHNQRVGAMYSVIQAADSRFMTGHAPIHCYKNAGWDILSITDKVWRIDGIDIAGKEYVVRKDLGETGPVTRNVRNFFIFPDGHFGATLEELEQAAQDYRKLKYGVTQVMLVTAGALTDVQRNEIFERLVGSEQSVHMIRTLRSGIPR